MKTSLKTIILVAAATIGSGAFALPYVIQRSGWLLSLGYFFVLIVVVSLAHTLYLMTLEKVDEKERLLGLARKYFGGAGFWIGFFAIVIGLLLGFVAYLVLGTQFALIIIPGISPAGALAIFWLAISVIIFQSEGKVTGFEAVGVTLIVCAILFVFVLGHPFRAFSNTPLIDPGNMFLPFGVALFSLAGWTSVEQVYELRKGRGKARRGFVSFLLGTMFAGALYWLFASGVLGTTAHATIDTISGVGGWPFWEKDILAVIGLLAMGVVSIPMAREIRGALEKDLKWNSFLSRIVIVGLPLAIVLAGFNNFLAVIGLAGGVFVSTQYLLIIAVGRRTLRLSQRGGILLDILTGIFICAAIYEIVTFIVH